MKREDLIAMGISEENVAKIMADYGSAVQKANAKSEQFKADAERVAELEKQLEKIQKQGMSDVELANAERDKALSSVANLEKQIEQMITKKSKELGYVAIYSADFDNNTCIIVDGEWSEIEAIEYCEDTEDVNVVTTKGDAKLSELYVGDLFTIYDLLDEFENI